MASACSTGDHLVRPGIRKRSSSAMERSRGFVMRAHTFILLSLLWNTSLCLAQEKQVLPATDTQPTEGAQSAKAGKSVSKGRTTIGVALEGGGALGEAHIGVLKWFEEHHIPIDYLSLIH